MPDEMAEILALARNGMTVEGEHHRAWFLEEIAKVAARIPEEPVTVIGPDGSEYEYMQRPRGPLAELWAAHRVYFDGEVPDDLDESLEYWVIEPGIAP